MNHADYGTIKFWLAKKVRSNLFRWHFRRGEWTLRLPAGQIDRFPGSTDPDWRGGVSDKSYYTPLAALGHRLERYILDPEKWGRNAVR